MKKFLLSIAAMALFAAPTFAQELADNQQEVEQVFSDEENGPAALQVVTSVLTRLEGNTYTLENVFNSGNSLTFSFNPEEADENGWAPITFHENPWAVMQDNGSYIDFRFYAADWAHWTINDATGSSVEMVDICFRQAGPTPWIYIDPDGWYQTQIYYWAEAVVEGSWLSSHYLSFMFEEVDEGEAAVAKVEIDETAPAVYYNLQGQKVANPSNGLYIVRQGKKVQKVMVK